MKTPASQVSDPLIEELARTLEQSGADDATLLRILDRLLGDFECTVGTIHSLDPAARLLRLRAQRGVPGTILDRLRLIPIGKGMAGLAAQRLEPVQVCNLQTDQSGTAEPAAKETQVEGSIALPMLVHGALRGVLGVAKPAPYEFSAAETARLMQLASLIARHLD